MAVAVFGTAHLFGLVAEGPSTQVLDAAWAAGFRAFDTAPLYGHGRSEAELGRRRAQWPAPVQVTSKAGLEPVAADSAAVRSAKAVVRRLPAGVRRRLRPVDDDGPVGDLDPALVRASLDRTRQRLGRVDRLMLHEARADDVTDELLAVLAEAVARGDVGQVGVATGNARTAAVVARAPALLTAAHVEIGPFAADHHLPPGVTVIGHGVLGAGGSALRRLAAVSTGTDGAGGAGGRWTAVTAGTRWAGTDGLAAALVARAAALPVTDVVVATSRVARLAGLRELAAGEVPLPAEVAAALRDLVDAARPASAG